MPPRKIRLVQGYIYHVFNRTIDKKPILTDNSLAQLLLELFFYYRSTKADISHSKFKRLDANRQAQILDGLSLKKFFKVEILGYCLMPTHFHLILKQLQDGAISKYMSDVLNALTRYYNILNERKGPIFLPRFQAKDIKSREQLIHVSRYKHLNPSSSGLIDIENLADYPWSSYPCFISEKKDPLCDNRLILAEFNNNKDAYRKFVINHAEHQKTLELLKYAEKWQ